MQVRAGSDTRPVRLVFLSGMPQLATRWSRRTCLRRFVESTKPHRGPQFARVSVSSVGPLFLIVAKNVVAPDEATGFPPPSVSILAGLWG